MNAYRNGQPSPHSSSHFQFANREKNLNIRSTILSAGCLPPRNILKTSLHRAMCLGSKLGIVQPIPSKSRSSGHMVAGPGSSYQPPRKFSFDIVMTCQTTISSFEKEKELMEVSFRSAA